jgi:hypothetical protein
MFDSKSRYVKLKTYTVVDRRGRQVQVVPVPDPPAEDSIGIHALREGERIDHLAAKYLSDPTGYWRIAEKNDAMLPEALTEKREIDIPGKAR